APVSTRRRTNSVAASCDLSCKKKQPESLQRPATEESNLLALGELPKPTRFRRSSFALSGERPTQLDGLVKEAAEHTTQVAASREAAKITSMVSPPSGVTKFQLDMGNTDGDSDDGSRKISVATLVPSSVGIPDHANQNCSFPCSRKTSDSAWGLSVNDAEHPFVWYNTDAFSQNPLSSELVRKYLAKSGVLQANTLSPSATPASVHSSRFDLTHVYEGLPASGFVSSNGTGSTAASVTSSPASRLPCDTPPCSPSTGSPLDSDHQNLLSSTNGLTRLRLFFDHWKPQVGTDESSNYIYLDQEAQERRANARASNVIAPVSF
ncbi:hypothetical protein FGIG_05682, partial [Fasciola gigantica]